MASQQTDHLSLEFGIRSKSLNSPESFDTAGWQLHTVGSFSSRDVHSTYHLPPESMRIQQSVHEHKPVGTPFQQCRGTLMLCQNLIRTAAAEIRNVEDAPRAKGNGLYYICKIANNFRINCLQHLRRLNTSIRGGRPPMSILFHFHHCAPCVMHCSVVSWLPWKQKGTMVAALRGEIMSNPKKDVSC